MAYTLPSDMKVYDQLAQSAYLERIQDNLQVFNGASNGAVTLTSEATQGDYSKTAIFDVGGSLVHRDVTSNGAVTPSKISQDELATVKTPWKYGPYAATEEAFKRVGDDPSLFFQLVGQDMADATLDYQIEAAFKSMWAAATAGSMVESGKSLSTDHKKVFTAAFRKMGDRMARIGMFAMSAATYLDVVDDALDQGAAYEETNTIVYGGQPGTFGRPVLVSDAIEDDRIFGLQRGAIQIVESQAPGVRSYEINDRENLTIGYRAEGAFNVGILGYAWTGDANPDIDALYDDGSTTGNATSDGWDKVFSSDKATAGVVVDLS